MSSSNACSPRIPRNDRRRPASWLPGCRLRSRVRPLTRSKVASRHRPPRSFRTPLQETCRQSRSCLPYPRRGRIVRARRTPRSSPTRGARSSSPSTKHSLRSPPRSNPTSPVRPAESRPGRRCWSGRRGPSGVVVGGSWSHSRSLLVFAVVLVWAFGKPDDAGPVEPPVLASGTSPEPAVAIGASSSNDVERAPVVTDAGSGGGRCGSPRRRRRGAAGRRARRGGGRAGGPGTRLRAAGGHGSGGR